MLRGAEVLAECREDMAKGQAERLMPLLEEVLRAEGLGWSDLSVIGVGIGPGNFTGVRIAVSAARGLALALGIPAIGVSTLEALAEGGPRPLTVLEDARRGEAYCQHFPEGAPELRALADLPVTGPEIGSAARGGLAPALPLATAIGRIAARRADLPQPRPAPLYLRGADAAPPSDPPPVILD